MQFHLSSGEYNIIASGDTFLFGPSEDLTIQINDDSVSPLRITLRFLEDSSAEKDIHTDIENDSLVITCMNFHGIGTGLKRPTHIADIDGKPVYFIFSSNYLGDKNTPIRSVKFTFFIAK